MMSYRNERGTAALETVLLTPLLVLLLLFVVLLGRYASARADVQGAAREAARAASIERTPGAASAAATSSAATALTSNGTSCPGFTTATDTTQFHHGGQVAVTVSCNIALADLSLLNVGPKAMQARFVAPIDQHRGGI